jgi:hypothetical protein
MRILDLFCGKFGWGRIFAQRGWDVVGVDLIEPSEVPSRCTFINADILTWDANDVRSGGFDFACASSPCEQFSLFGMKHFHPNPAYPALGIELFNHTRKILEESGVPYIMENVRNAKDFVGKPTNKCGPFYLWGNSVPPLMPQGITKGVKMGSGSAIRGFTQEQKRLYRKQFDAMQCSGKGEKRKAYTASWATIPPELANCVADYAERLSEAVSQT